MLRRVDLLVGLLVIVLPIGGCSGPTTPTVSTPTLQGARIVVAAVGDAGILPVVAAQRGEWQASRGAECAVRDKAVTPSDLDGCTCLAISRRPDRLTCRCGRRWRCCRKTRCNRPPKLTANRKSLLRPRIPTEEGGLRFDDIIPALRDEASKYGPDRVALPLGGTALVLVYDRTALGKDVRPPKTWDEFDALVNRLHHESRAGVVWALGRDAEGVGNAVFLNRAATLGQHPHHYSLLFDSDDMQPRLTSPPFVEALEKLLAIKPLTPPGAESFDANAARSAFRDGKAVFLIDRAENACALGRWSSQVDRRRPVAGFASRF